MAGKFPIKQFSVLQLSLMKKIIVKWQKGIFKTKDSWEANDLHIDEIDKQFKKRDTWLESGLFCYELLLENNIEYSNSLLIPFVHFSLMDSNKVDPVLTLSTDFINKQLHEFTPPSLMYIDKNYLSGELSKEFSKCGIDDSDLLLNNYRYNFYFRKWYDKVEKMYTRELYVFFFPSNILRLGSSPHEPFA